MDDISSVQNVNKVTSYASLESQVRAKSRQGRAHCLSCSKNLHVVYIVAILMKLLNDTITQYISGSHNKSTRDVKATTINYHLQRFALRMMSRRASSWCSCRDTISLNLIWHMSYSPIDWSNFCHVQRQRVLHNYIHQLHTTDVPHKVEAAFNFIIRLLWHPATICNLAK